MARIGGLGKGMAALLQVTETVDESKNYFICPIEKIRPNRNQPRKYFAAEKLEELAASIREKGIIQPLVVTRIDGGYEIIAGERRWRAAQKAGLHTVPVIVRDLNDQEVLELAIIENVQRADLNSIEEAGGYNDLMEQFGYTQERMAEVIGKSRSHVANTLRLLKLPDSVKALVQSGRLTAGHARALVGRDDAEVLAIRIVEEGLNVRDVEALVQSLDNPTERRRVREKDADTRAFEKELADTLGLKVEIKRGSGESGTLLIKYGNFDQ